MAFETIYSRTFLIKVFAWPKSLQDMAFEAAKHAALAPDLNDYKRDYLTPYRQKHPTTDHQYTLFFTVHDQSHIFIVWINDSTCLHDTRANFQDPCRKEFERLRKNGQLENYEASKHHVQFKVHPDSSKPIRCHSRYLGYDIYLNSYMIGTTEFVGHAFVCEEPNREIAKIHTSEFLALLHKHLSQKNFKLKFQFTKMGHDEEVALLTNSYDVSQWRVIDDPEDFILEKI